MNHVQQKYIYQMIALVCLILLVSGGGGLGILVLRQQISVSAERARQAELQIAGFDRKIRQIDARIAAVHHPDALLERSRAVGLRLQQPERNQVIRLEAGPAQRRYAQQTPPSVDSSSDPLFISIDLALMELPVRAKP